MSFYFDSDDEDRGENTFACATCGSAQSYSDDAGNLFCTLCFSQSQTQQNEAELDYEEVQALVARGRGGQMIGMAHSYHRRRGRTFERRPNESYDVSKPFPSLEECLQGYTTVIQACLKSVIQVLGLTESQSIDVHYAIRQVWLGFLRSWQDGADFYRKYHPEVRISLRDSFLNQPLHKSMLFRFLTNSALERIKKEQSADYDSDSDSDDEGDRADAVKSSANVDSTAIPLPQNTGIPKAHATLPSLLNMYRRKGPGEAALRLSLTMSTVASLLLAALCKLGVAAPHLVKWISTGEIPLLNPYMTVFDKSMQLKMEAIAYAFRMDRVPTTEGIEFQTKLLLIAVGQPPSLITKASAPLLAMRLVSDLNLEPRILNITLALMGERPQTTDEWLPAALKSLEQIKSRPHILAAIAVACKLVHGFERRKYGWDHGSVVPWNDEQILDLKNPSTYVDFVDTHVIAGRNENRQHNMPDFLKEIDRRMPTQQKAQKSPIPIMAGEPNPRQPSMKRLQKYHEWNARLKKRKAIWADANGVQHYMVYNYHSRYEHLHPHYQVLLETMSLLADVKASTIHTSVCVLDQEILYICRPWDEPLHHKVRMRRKNRKISSTIATRSCIDDSTTKLESGRNATDSSSSESSEVESQSNTSDSSSSDAEFSHALI